MSRRTKKRKQFPPSQFVHFSNHWHYGVLLLVVVSFGLIRFRLRDMPLERDEGEYAYAGQLILQGIPPYRLAYNMKLPGTYAAYSVLLAIFGQSAGGIHCGLLVVNALTTVLIFLLATRLFDRLAGVVAAMAYALLSTSPSVLGFAGHATHFVVAAAIAGLLALHEGTIKHSRVLLFSAGLLLGLAFLMKQPGIYFVVLGFLYLVHNEWKQPSSRWDSVANLAIFSIGVCLPFALTCLLLLRTGVFRQFWFWTFAYAREYGSRETLSEGLNNFLSTAPGVVGSSFLVWILAGLGLLSPLWNRRAAAHAGFLVALFVCSSLAVALGLYFRPHYFILVLPTVSLFAGAAVSYGKQTALAGERHRVWALVPALLFMFAFAYAVFHQRDFLFQLDPTSACRRLYGANPFPEAITVGDYLRQQTPEGATVAVLGSEPEIYFYSHRHSATGYVYTYALMEEQKYALTMQKEMISEIENSQPEFLVYINVPTSWLWADDSPQKTAFLSWVGSFVAGKYELEGVVDILTGGTQYHWGGDAGNYSTHSQFSVDIFRRKRS